MNNWIKVTLLLCAFGTLREIRPSEPFVSEFILGEWRNITQEQLNRDVYPIGTYSLLIQLLIVFLITDFLRFKPVIIISGLSGIAVYAILLWTTSLKWLQVSQFAYGLYMATEVAYFTYIYAKVDSDKYPKVSSYTRMAALTGRFLSSVLSQLLVMFSIMDLRQLNYITFSAQIIATFWAIWLPPVKYGIYFHRRTSLASKQKGVAQLQITDSVKTSSNTSEAISLILKHTYTAYKRPKVVAWSVLYASSMALFVQTQTYMQLLWRTVQESDIESVSYNGFVEAAQTLIGAGGAYIASLYDKHLVLVLITTLQGGALFCGTFVPNVFVSYAGYIVVGALYHYTITLASAKIAGQLSDESCFGLIFGINTFIGTGLQSLLTLVLITQMNLSIHLQYYCISVLYIVLATVWLLTSIGRTVLVKRGIV